MHINNAKLTIEKLTIAKLTNAKATLDIKSYPEQKPVFKVDKILS